MLEKNQVIKDVKIIDYTHEGLGVTKIDNFAIFVKYAKVGCTYDIKIIKVLKQFAVAIIVSDNIPKAQCEYYKNCGGCDLMHLDYEEQLNFKKKSVENTLRKFNLDIDVKDVVKSDVPLHYRNKVLMPFVQNNGVIELGFFRNKSHQVEPIKKCLIQSDKANEVFNYVVYLLNQVGETVYNEDSHKGNLRHLYLRESHTNPFMMVCFVLNSDKLKQQKYIVTELTKKFPEIKSIVINVNQRRTNAVLGYKNINLYNCNFIEETILGNKYRLAPNAFFQVNTKQCEKLYTKALEACELTGNENVLDAYCGVGSITLSLAKNAKHVTGIEIVEPAIASAKVNAKINNIDNVSFICNDIENEILKYENKDEFFDVVVVDPPRKGLEANFIRILLKYKPKRVVYVSCNPATLGRDLELLNVVYSIDNIVPVDMFSQTTHIECVAKLTLR